VKEVWDGVAGTAISQLTGHGNYSNRPLARDFIPSFESFHTNWTDTFGTRVTGFIVPQVSGSYSFAVAGDDIVELYLSTGASEGNKALIASVPSWTAFREWTKFPEQISTTRTLTAGNRYYVELRHVEASGDDHFSVAWKTPGSATWEVIGGDYLVQAGIDRSQPGESSLLDTLATGHPRVLATQERFDWLKAQITANPTGNQAVWYNNKLLPRANAILTEPVNVYDSSDNLDVTRSVLERIYTLALVWQVSGDNQYAERAWDELDAARNFPSWQPSKFLCVAEMTHAFAIGMDWFYHYWSSSRMTSIRNAIVNKGFNPGIAAYDGNEWWTQNDANNWNLVCNGGLVLGVLANGTYDEAKAEKILQRALASARPVLDHYTADNGAWYEGSAYWGYSAQYLVRMLSGMESVLGSDFGYLSSKKGLSESGVVPMHMTGPTESMFNFGDTANYERAGPELFWFARRYNRPVCAWFQRNFCNDGDGGPEALDLLWYDPRGSNPAVESVAPDVYFRGATTPTSPSFDTLEAGVFREKWNDSRATYLAFKGGHIGDHAHSDLDAGSFILQANGKNWALDMGAESYSMPGIFNTASSSGTDRWDYYRKRAEGHNTLVINPDNGPDQRLGYNTPIEFWRSSPDGDGSISIVDLTRAYDGANEIRRGFRLLNDRNDVIVQDEIDLSTASTVWWFMHFNSEQISASIAGDGSSATLTQGNERLWCKILSGDGVFTLREAAPFSSSPDPSGQKTNSFATKLSIKLTGVTSTRLTVYLKPLANGDPIPAILPAVTSLNAWTISAINDAPTISNVGNQTVNEDTATATLPVIVGDDLTAAASLTLTKASSNTNLVPTANIVFGGSGASRTVTVTPALNKSGTATITLDVNDGTSTTSDTFTLTVNAVNDAPAISDIPDQAVPENVVIGPLPFTIGDAESAATSLTVTAQSSSATLLPLTNIVLSGSGSNRFITLRPATNQTGYVTVTLLVGDGALTSSNSFIINFGLVNDPPSSCVLTSPGNGQTLLLPPTFTATATDPDNNLVRVSFYADDSKAGEDTTAPYSFTWSNANAGAHALFAVAIDAGGLRLTSAVANVTLLASNNLIRPGAVWRFLDDGSDQGSAWRGSAFNDAAWNSGPAQLGYGDGDEATVVNYGPSATNKYITTWFRRSFSLADASVIHSLQASLLRDDGAAVYLNGAEVWRSNLPTNGPIGHTTLASAAISGSGESAWLTTNLNPALLVDGTNVVAVEIHQSDRDSSDLTFDFGLTATSVAPLSNQPPDLLLTQPAHGKAFAVPATVTVNAFAQDPDGLVAKVEFFVGETKIGERSAAPYSLMLSNLPIGDYTLSAVATDNQGASVFSLNAPAILIRPSVAATMLHPGAIWRYFDRTNDLGTSWRSNSFNDATWSSGLARFGFGDDGEVTKVSSNRQWTTYFRRSFYVPDPALVQDLSARLTRDDGAVVYLNGSEIWRDTNMPSVGITNQTPALSALGGTNETNWLSLSLPPSTLALLTPGWNLLAAEVHQSALNSSDLGFDLELTGTVILAELPELQATIAGSSLVLTAPDTAAYFRLFSATNLMPPVVWTPDATAAVLSNSQWRVTLPAATNGQRFYRLQSP
jgi:Heparinase II/III-like protein/Bacterial Ig domain/PA14 domain